MTELQQRLAAIADPQYADFQAKLTPTLPRGSFIGVRVPQLRKFAKDFAKTPEAVAFLESLPHQTYDENLLHSILLETSVKDFATCLASVNAFLPFVDNWAVCDTLRPKIFARHKEELLSHIEKWIRSPLPYTCRFGLDMLMTHYLDDCFDPSFLELAASVKSEEYYVRMMAAWFFATALSKQWEATIPYLEQNRLEDWVHKKTVQKACESYRITPEQKTYLKTLVNQ